MNRRLFLFGLCFCLVFALPHLSAAQAEKPAAKAAPAATSWTPEEQMKVKGVGGVQVSPDGRRAVFTVGEAVMTGEKSENLTQIYMAAADGSGAYQFTFGDKSSTNPQWSPDGKWIAFTTSRSGKNNLWLIRSEGGEAEQLSDVKSSVGGFAWSPDGKWIAFISPEAPSDAEEKSKKEKNDAQVVDDNFKFNHIWVIPIARDAAGKREARQVTKGKFHVTGGGDWAPDGKTIVFSHQRTPRVDDWTTADISTVDVASGEITPLVNSAAAETSPLYSPDGRFVAFVATTIPVTWGQSNLVHIIPATGGQPRALAETPDRQPDLLGWSSDGKRIFVAETRGTVSRISALPVAGGPPQDLDAGNGVFGSVNLNRAGTAFGLSWQTPLKAAEAYTTRADRFAPVQISRVNAELPSYPLGRTEVVRWKASDGLEVEGLLTYPVGYETGKRVPMLLVIHGGPAGVFTQSFIAGRGVYPLATFAAQGYAILRCNIRGSSGYGAKFRHANYNDWGGMDFKDLMAGVDHVIAMGVADADRLGVMGWSYGGFMTSWVITQTKRFKAASIGAPVTNLMSFTGTSDIPSFVPDYFGGEFWDKPDAYQKHSAMFNIKGASTPALIQQGERDERVPIAQGFELYNALKRQGSTVQMVTYPRMPHGLTEPKLLLDAAKRNVDWFAKYLLSSPAPAK